jgi:hypothetical protein
VLLDLHAGPEHNPSSIPSDRSMPMSGFLDELAAGVTDIGGELVLIVRRVESEAADPGNGLVLGVLEVLHDGPVQKPSRIPNDRSRLTKGFLLEIDAWLVGERVELMETGRTALLDCIAEDVRLGVSVNCEGDEADEVRPPPKNESNGPRSMIAFWLVVGFCVKES